MQKTTPKYKIAYQNTKLHTKIIESSNKNTKNIKIINTIIKLIIIKLINKKLLN